jgi:CRISPR-associated exonuclease Cas4
MTSWVLVLIMAIGVYLLVGRWTRAERIQLGVDKHIVVGADDSALGIRTLRSERLGLVGRPDHLVRAGRMLIPVEQKPNARRLQSSHVLQVAAQCLLVEEVYRVRPAYGLVVLAGGVQERVAFTPELEDRLMATMGQMRELLATGREPGPRWIEYKCRSCAFRSACW